ncbi:MAG: hypothetical protein EBZ48_14210, partial [Proteobacteria bacterium]|nr:hypothetical protein [Pseudomonadota bacterium]
RTVGTPHASIAGSNQTTHIETQTFRRISVETGEWGGIVNGNGQIRLGLQILQGGQVTSTRWMGEVELANKPTSFHFISSIPSTSDWTWRIITVAVPSAQGRARL